MQQGFKRRSRACSVLLLALFLSAVLGKDILVDPSTGRDEPGCGCSSLPCATPGYVMTSVADSGDRVLLRGDQMLSRPIAIMKDVVIIGVVDDSAEEQGVVLDCQEGMFSGVSIAPGLRVEMRNLVIQNCRPTTSGAIESVGSQLLMENVVVRNNTRLRGAGAGIALSGGRAKLVANRLEENFSTKGGAGISCVDCELMMESCVIAGNESPQGPGAGIFVNGASKVTGRELSIIGNSGSIGSGLFVKGDQAEIEFINAEFLDNIASADTCSQVTIEGTKNPSEDQDEVQCRFIACTFGFTKESEEEEEMTETTDHYDDYDEEYRKKPTREGVCFANTSVEFAQSEFLNCGVTSFNARFSMDECEFDPMPQDGEGPVTCVNSNGWFDREQICQAN